MNSIDDRFKDAPWYEKSKRENILVIGAGGISSNTMYNLAKTIPAFYTIIDFDKVEDINVGTQFFKKEQLNSYKTQALYITLMEFSNVRLLANTHKYAGQYTPIMITGLDNMATRKQSYEVWKSRPNRELFIDGRMKANLYEVYTVIPGREEQYEATLFDDSEVAEGPCTFKQTAYVGMMIGSRITQIVVNYLTNKYSGVEVCTVPFSVKELTEAFYIDIQ